MYMRCFKLISISNKAQKSILHALLLFSERQCIDFNLFCKVWLGEGEFTSDSVTGSASRQPTLLCPFLPCRKAPTQRQIRAETYRHHSSGKASGPCFKPRHLSLKSGKENKRHTVKTLSAVGGPPPSAWY